MAAVKRLQIMIEEELDAELGRQAAREGVSKAALIRRYVGERLRPLPPLEEDPLWGIVGMIKDGSPDDSSRIDEVVYDLGR
jgi:Ribbon-helix-helix protein, copG family